MENSHILHKVAEAARRRGFLVEQLKCGGRNHQRFRRKALTVEGKTCLVHTAAAPYKVHHSSDRMYYMIRVRRSPIEKADVLIVAVQCGEQATRFFLIPTTLLRTAWGSREEFRLCIPSQAYTYYNNCAPTINWLQYENAWHLLR